MPEHDSARATSLPPIADPGPVGLAGLALTIFILGGNSAHFIPDLIWVGVAILYGGLTQFLAGIWEFRRGNTFAATVFSSYGAFFLGLAGFGLIIVVGRVPFDSSSGALGWLLFALFVFNTYIVVASTRTNMAVFAVFLGLEIAEIVDAIGFWSGNAQGQGWLLIGGWVGIVTAAVAWYASSAGVINSLLARPLVWVGSPLWNPSTASQR
jgi:uncharacterized protein